MGVEARALARARVPASFEEPRGEIAADHCGTPGIPDLDGVRGGAKGADSRRANTLDTERRHGRRLEEALNLVCETWRGNVGSGGACGQKVDIGGGQTSLGKGVGDGVCGHLGIRYERSALGVERVMTRVNAVLRENAPLDPRGARVDRGDETIHRIVVDGRARQEATGGGQVDVPQFGYVDCPGQKPPLMEFEGRVSPAACRPE